MNIILSLILILNIFKLIILGTMLKLININCSVVLLEKTAKNLILY